MDKHLKEFYSNDPSYRALSESDQIRLFDQWAVSRGLNLRMVYRSRFSNKTRQWLQWTFFGSLAVLPWLGETLRNVVLLLSVSGFFLLFFCFNRVPRITADNESQIGSDRDESGHRLLHLTGAEMALVDDVDNLIVRTRFLVRGCFICFGILTALTIFLRNKAIGGGSGYYDFLHYAAPSLLLLAIGFRIALKYLRIIQKIAKPQDIDTHRQPHRSK